MKRSTSSIRAEIHAIVMAAKDAGKTITGYIVWGLLTRDVAEESFHTILSRMCSAGQLRSMPGGPEQALARGGKPRPLYEPGAVAVKDESGPNERLSSFMGNREMLRLLDARKAARKWKQEGTR